MSTLFSEIITKYGMHFIDDARWSEQLQLNAAQFFRAKSQFLVSSIPLFRRPPNIQGLLKYQDALFDDYSYTATENQTAPVEIDTNCIGYDICSVGTIVEESDGGITYTPITDFTYDQDFGIVTLNEDVSEGQRLDFDFYTDGFFYNDLNNTQKRILGLCMSVDWFYNFSNEFLNVLNVIADKTFSPKSAPAEDKRANTNRYEVLRHQLASELMAYEQTLYAMKTIPTSGWSNLVKLEQPTAEPISRGPVTTRQNLQMYRGDTMSFAVSISGLDQDLDTAFFTCKDRSGNVVFQKSLGDGITKESTGVYRVRVAPSDTESVACGKYLYDLQIEANEDKFTVMKGVLQIDQDVTD